MEYSRTKGREKEREKTEEENQWRRASGQLIKGLKLVLYYR